MYQTISATEFRRRLAREPNLTMIDVRTPAEFREIHVVGAENRPLDRLDPNKFVDVSGELFIICRTGNRGAMACDKLVAAGVTELINIEGGTLACEEVGVEVRRGKKMMSLERQVRITAGLLVIIGAALSFVHPAWVGLSAFVGAGLVFAGVTDTCGMGMLLAEMPWNQATTSDSSASGSSTPTACSRPA